MGNILRKDTGLLVSVILPVVKLFPGDRTVRYQEWCNVPQKTETTAGTSLLGHRSCAAVTDPGRSNSAKHSCHHCLPALCVPQSISLSAPPAYITQCSSRTERATHLGQPFYCKKNFQRAAASQLPTQPAHFDSWGFPVLFLPPLLVPRQGAQYWSHCDARLPAYSIYSWACFPWWLGDLQR